MPRLQLRPWRALREPGKHPRTRHGLKDATADVDLIRRWDKKWTDANWGALTGVTFDALDVDGPEGEAALADHDESIDGPTVATGRGWHVYLQPTGFRNKTGFVPGCDWRGDGGYVVVPESVHYSGKLYTWELPDDPVFGPDGPLQPAPGWLLDLLEPPKEGTVTGDPIAEFLAAAGTSAGYASAALDSELARLLKARTGQRNNQLNVAAFNLGQLVAGGALEDAFVIRCLLHAATEIGLGAIEAERTITSGLKSGMAQPRRVPA